MGGKKKYIEMFGSFTSNVCMAQHHVTLQFALLKSLVVHRAGSEVVRIDPLHFLAGCRTRRLNQAYLSMLYYCIMVY